MNILISGGCKNGKSYYAQRAAWRMAHGREYGQAELTAQTQESGQTHGQMRVRADEPQRPLYYVATMLPVDREDRARIKRHIRERKGWDFVTIEQPQQICECLQNSEICKGGVFLLDSVTALLSNEMFGADGSVDLDAPVRVAGELVQFAHATRNTVFVSDFIYSDAILYGELTEKYRRGLALIDRTLAEVCDRVYEVSYSQIISYKR